MRTTEFMIAGLLPEAAADLGVDLAKAGMLITAFAGGMIVGPHWPHCGCRDGPRCSWRWRSSPPGTSSRR